MLPQTQAEPLRNFIDGDWAPSASGEWREIRNPATGEALARVPFSTPAEVAAAVASAQAVLPEWRATPAMTRARYLFTLKGLMERDFEALSRTVVREHGKTLDEARGEVRRAIENVEVACGIPSLLLGYNLPDVASGIDVSALREPLGVCAVVPPYNFPLMVPMWFIPIALACGNTVVIKPSEQVPMSVNRLFALFAEAGFPPGVVNLVNGGRAVVEALAEHPDVRAISFVGSSPVAKALYAKAAANGKRAQCQGGAKNFVAVMPDADLARSVPSLVTSFYGCSGQRCLAGSVLLAVGAVAEPLSERFAAAAAALKVGDGLDETVQMGPVISRQHKERILAHIESGLKEGARLVLDGRPLKVAAAGDAFLGPCVFDRVEPGMAIAREEIFGPVACIVRVDSLDQAIGIIDRNPYGNAAAIYTGSGRAARDFRARVACGNIGINVGVPAPVAFFPFGGMKGSFFGDLHGQGRDGIDFFTDRKVVIERWS